MASKVPVDVEVCLHGHSTLQPRAAREMVAKAFAKSTAAFVPGHFTVGADDAALAANVASVRICELREWPPVRARDGGRACALRECTAPVTLAHARARSIELAPEVAPPPAHCFPLAARPLLLQPRTWCRCRSGAPR